MTAGNHLGKALAMLASPFHKEPWLSFWQTHSRCQRGCSHLYHCPYRQAPSQCPSHRTQDNFFRNSHQRKNH
jgi:hypothetical protein